MAFLNPLVSPDSAYAYRQGISRIPLLVYTPGTGPSTPFSLSSQPSETGLKASLLWSTIPLTPKPSPFGVSRRFRFLNKTCVILGLLISLLWLALGSGRSRISFEFRMTVEKDELEGLQWIDAHHPDIRYVGRWTSTSDGARKEGSFPGIYFDIAINGSSSLFLSLNNSVGSATLDSSSAAPISLLARVDDEEYVVLPNVSAIVAVRKGNMSPGDRHEIRIIAPLTGGGNDETLQFEGLWIDSGGRVLPSFSEKEVVLGLRTQPKRKMLEIVTDQFGSMAGKDRRKHTSDFGIHSILGAVMGWEYLIGEMFGADHATTGIQGMCLVQDCIGARGSPAGLADVFFQSGPHGSDQNQHPWLFESDIPDVIVLNIGQSDWSSFSSHTATYNASLWELSVTFEDTYVSLLKAIRTLAYPKYNPSLLDTIPTKHPVIDIPIFVMRPFRGGLEEATLAVVEKLRMEGDRNVFWLDTSGWLNEDVGGEGMPDEQDFYLDELSTNKEWRLTERGNQRVAILLHMHVCTFLAMDAENCASTRIDE